MIISRRLLLLPVLLFSILPGGCRGPVREGEALSYGQGSFRSSFLPRFSLGKTGTHEFQVSNLQSRSFPSRLRIYGRGGSYAGHPRLDTFDSARVKVEVLENSSRKVLASKVFRLNTTQYVKNGEHDQWFWFGKEPHLEFKSSYRVRVTVLAPSRREHDEARVMLR